MQSNSIGRPNLSGIVGAHLKRRIFEGEFAPGEKIVEEEIAQRLGTSRTPVKLALTELAKEGLVELIPRRGAYVRSFSHADIIELYEIRRAFEGLAGRLAARYITERGLAELIEANRHYSEAVDEMAESNPIDAAGMRKTKALDMAFHRKIVEATGNRNLEMLSGLEAIEYLSFLHGEPIDPVRTGYTVRESHDRIIQAIESRDEDAAEALSREHIMHAIETLEVQNRRGGARHTEAMTPNRGAHE